MIVWYDIGDMDSLSSTWLILDLSKNKMPWTLSWAIITNWKVKNWLYFDGVDDYFSTNLYSLWFSVTWSIALWINSDDNLASVISVRTWISALNDEFLFYLSNWRIRLYNHKSSWNANNIQSIKSINDWNRHFVVVEMKWAWICGAMDVYIDWVKDSYTCWTSWTPTDISDVIRWVFIWKRNTTEEFKWYLDEVRIYNRALSDSEIQELYNSTK